MKNSFYVYKEILQGKSKKIFMKLEFGRCLGVKFLRYCSLYTLPNVLKCEGLSLRENGGVRIGTQLAVYGTAYLTLIRKDPAG